jgi:TPP-dependent pyruvate/acetoin dehydrogenase alpha subunit
MYDAELYRSKQEVAQWKQRDPITMLERQLRVNGLVVDGETPKMEAVIADEIADAEAFAEAGTWEPLEDLTKDVYTPAKPRG